MGGSREKLWSNSVIHTFLFFCRFYAVICPISLELGLWNFSFFCMVLLILIDKKYDLTIFHLYTIFFILSVYRGVAILVFDMNLISGMVYIPPPHLLLLK